MLKSFTAAAAAISLAAIASADYTPIAWGLAGGAPVGRYFTRTVDISADGLTFVGQLDNGDFRYVSPTANLGFAGTAGVLGMSTDGARIVGGTLSTPPAQWLPATAVSNTMTSSPLPQPAGSNLLGQAYHIAANGTYGMVASTTHIWAVNGSSRTNVSQLITTQGGSSGAYRGIADDAPVAIMLASFSGNNTNMYRINYATGAVQALNLLPGATHGDAGNHAISRDGTIIGGNVNISSLGRPCWWDASGTAHLIPNYTNAFTNYFGGMTALNLTGTLGGGGISGPGVPSRAFLYHFATDTTLDLNQVYASLLPAGWRLTTTQHISDDGSRIYCLAVGPDNVTRSVILTGSIPAPGAAGALALGLCASLRRRRK
ncbi:MAG TPA: hypothetical protein VD997_13510 [Phycisphaerales bacterium]|nr:hypothetical protein [Phycisphaerales bacterium]